MGWRLLDRIESIGLCSLLAAMTLITFVQVVLRYLFNDSLHWAVEATSVCFGWLIFLGISYGIRTGSHIGVEALMRLLPAQAARMVSILAVLICMAYCVVLGYGGYTYVAKLVKVGVLMQDIPIPRWIPPVMVPLGLALAFLRFAQVLVRLLQGRQTRLDLADEAAEALASDVNVQRAQDGPPAARP
ncbi:MAG TPA: TRAP transporter small permease [Kiloniellales bacterium]|nr:TRAP transporter small permease [Kiloniellales bacterium]